MQQSITSTTLQQFGINLPIDQEETILQKLNELLEERIGAEIAASLDDIQLEQMADIQDDDPAKLEEWIAANVPELQEIVQDEFDILMDEIVKNEGSLTA